MKRGGRGRRIYRQGIPAVDFFFDVWAQAGPCAERYRHELLRGIIELVSLDVNDAPCPEDRPLVVHKAIILGSSAILEEVAGRLDEIPPQTRAYLSFAQVAYDACRNLSSDFSRKLAWSGLTPYEHNESMQDLRSAGLTVCQTFNATYGQLSPGSPQT